MPWIYRVNVKTGETKKETMKKEDVLYGGRGLVAKILTEEVNPKCDPLGSENKLLFCTSILSGTTVPSSGRLSVGGKSPLTGGIKEANSGGTLGGMLGNHGIRAVIVEDIPEQEQSWKIIYIDENGVMSLIPANEYVGLNNYELVEKLMEKFGKDIAVGSIGVAGERMNLASAVMVTDYSNDKPSRAAGRGGLGALMGSKKVKAIVVKKPKKPYKFPYADDGLFKQAVKRHFQTQFKNSDPKTPNIGTIRMLSLTGPAAIVPVKNFSGERLEDEKLQKLLPESYLELMNKRGSKIGIGCMPGCFSRCSNEYYDKDGKYVTSGFEYETVALCGTNCYISDFDMIAKMDRFCDDIGLDTIDFGAAIAVAMEAGRIPWGDHEGVEKAMQEAYEGTEFGLALCNGAAYLGKKLGVKRIPAVKNQAIPAYDPRNLKGNGVTYATSAMGADHTAGMVVREGGDPLKKDEKVYYSRLSQIKAATHDCFLCAFNSQPVGEDPSILTDYIKGAYGIEMNTDQVYEIGVNILKMEQEFNRKAGFTPDDDDVPEFMRKEPSKFTNSVFDFTKEELQMAKVFALER